MLLVAQYAPLLPIQLRSILIMIRVKLNFLFFFYFTDFIDFQPPEIVLIRRVRKKYIITIEVYNFYNM